MFLKKHSKKKADKLLDKIVYLFFSRIFRIIPKIKILK